ncbi:hypothetical protein MATL_G00066420 [Megalops atlanticus]|uniref:Uncharacterized protein n=1 Tax=Megalops atlanticus TaxID=7932 RepID=A0A9D3Q7X7_MEGAT|nr:hypothetical protein MATL_G00066420 [Megalops atlanticus]
MGLETDDRKLLLFNHVRGGRHPPPLIPPFTPLDRLNGARFWQRASPSVFGTGSEESECPPALEAPSSRGPRRRPRPFSPCNAAVFPHGLSQRAPHWRLSDRFHNSLRCRPEHPQHEGGHF